MTVQVQDIGNTEAEEGLEDGLYAVEENRTYGTKNRVWVEGTEGAQFSGAVPGVWD